jgi:hypothetical protein
MSICIVTPQMLILIGGIFLGVVLIAVYYFVMRWDDLMEEAYDNAFNSIDADKSGYIDEVELELAVVLLYCEVFNKLYYRA